MMQDNRFQKFGDGTSYPYSHIRRVTGEVVMKGLTQIALPRDEDVEEFDGIAPDNHYWSFEQGAYVPMGEAPSEYHKWDWNIHQYVFKEEARADIWNLITAERNRRNLAGVLVGDTWFHSDLASRNKYVNVYITGTTEPEWKAKGGVWLEMTPDKAHEVLLAIAAHDKAVFEAAEAHKAALYASTYPERYDWHADWPQTYAEASA